MYIEQLYTGCLAHGAYYIESNGEAAIIDPLREPDPYIKKAAERGVRIRYVFETHFHADFVSGHLDLARKTGAAVIYGPNAKADYEIYVARDGEEFELGGVKIRTIHTPGHTLESSCFLLLDEQGKEHCLFSGDTIFIGDVGRPDLAVKSGLTREDLAGMLYDSIQKKIMPLSDDLIIYPGHGAGSACGKNLSKEPWDTLGNQKKVNYALKSGMTREEFIREVTEGILPPPQYFLKNAMINKTGYESMESIMKRGDVPLGPDDFERLAAENEALILDTRTADEFAAAHIPGSVFIGLDGTFAPWVGALITDLNQPILFIATPGKEEEVVTRLSRVGYDHTIGYLADGMLAWMASGRKTESVPSVDPKTFVSTVLHEGNQVIDVRRQGEFLNGHVNNAINIPLDYINEHMGDITHQGKYYVHCAGGYRSMIFISILMARGYRNLVNITGGWSAIEAELERETSTAG
ncbi:MAG: hypothetical protein RL220_1278 [Bacteroidota bacterium]